MKPCQGPVRCCPLRTGFFIWGAARSDLTTVILRSGAAYATDSITGNSGPWQGFCPARRTSDHARLCGVIFCLPPRLATAPQLAARLYAIQLLDEVVVIVS